MKKDSIFFNKIQFAMIRVIPFVVYIAFYFDFFKAIKNNFIMDLFQMLFVTYFVGHNLYLIGLYLDYLFKVYYHLNSSLDRLIYRILFGAGVASIAYYLLDSVLTDNILLLFSFGVGVFNFIFSIYPTSSRLVYSSINSNLSEIRHLDKLEKTLLVIFMFYFISSVPNLNFVKNSGYDHFLTNDLFHQVSKPLILIFKNINIANFLSGYFYFLMGGLFYLIAYSFFRFFFSRRVSLIGILAIISNWNLVKIVYADFTTYASSMYLISFLWALVWVASSRSYRTSLFYGIILATCVHHPVEISLMILIVGIISRFLIDSNQTNWSRLQSFRYMSLGIFLALSVIANDLFMGRDYIFQLGNDLNVSMLFKKSFNILSGLGIILFLATTLLVKQNKIKNNFSFIFNGKFLILSGLLYLGILFLSDFGSKFNIIGFSYFSMVLFSMPVLEIILSSFGSLSLKRNLIFLIYILFVILDSHFESRVKSFLSFI